MKGKPWEEKDKTYLKKHWNTKGHSELARILRRTVPAVRVMGWKLRLPPKTTIYRQAGAGVDWNKPESIESIKPNTNSPLQRILLNQAEAGFLQNSGESK